MISSILIRTTRGSCCDYFSHFTEKKPMHKWVKYIQEDHINSRDELRTWGSRPFLLHLPGAPLDPDSSQKEHIQDLLFTRAGK